MACLPERLDAVQNLDISESFLQAHVPVNA